MYCVGVYSVASCSVGSDKQGKCAVDAADLLEAGIFTMANRILNIFKTEMRQIPYRLICVCRTNSSFIHIHSFIQYTRLNVIGSQGINVQVLAMVLELYYAHGILICDFSVISY